MKRQFIFLVLITLVTFSAGCIRTTSNTLSPTVDVPNISQGKFAIQDMRKAIVAGCSERQWVASDIDNTTIEATIIVRGKHTVVVSIPYTENSYSIEYKSSVNMDYKPNSDGTFSINRSYNNWVNNLYQAINANITRMQK